ncbi:hypothetical protein P152DRAFT_471614 [Eremomyces bilateralis CBS 781.70]|uniref:Uncharacterized protein n=1 Tax=Eremomyces bilateralis CBS 781.70 TaxID=1392243 RepID=A0A6G1GAM8_9PEZI|nr:uncharacterized protein P152DRAFT_471614 [Eremomyces bilateralis CBS 781.70]KAF1814961.1 hypothetical protein P152DRAFT_471614 [Eremomyces bilateralis CBS 781.70]
MSAQSYFIPEKAASEHRVDCASPEHLEEDLLKGILRYVRLKESYVNFVDFATHMKPVIGIHYDTPDGKQRPIEPAWRRKVFERVFQELVKMGVTSCIKAKKTHKEARKTFNLGALEDSLPDTDTWTYGAELTPPVPQQWERTLPILPSRRMNNLHLPLLLNNGK